MDLTKAKRTVSIISVALLLISFVLLFFVSKNSDESEDLLRDNIMFVSSKLDTELARFIRGLTVYGNERFGISRDELHHQLDVLWSRLIISSEGSTGRRIRSHANAGAALSNLKQALQQEEQAILALEPADDDERERLIDRFAGLTNEIHALTINVLRDEQASMVQTSQNLHRTRQSLFICIFFALLCALTLFTIMLVEMRRSQKYERQNMSLMAVAENFGLGVVATHTREAGHTIEFCNAAFCNYTGHKDKDLRGAGLQEVLSFRAREPGQICLDSGNDQKIEFLCDDPSDNGTRTIPTLFEYQKIGSHSYAHDHRLGVLRDITEQQQHENALVVAKENAEAGSRAKSDFLATMSHEIRTPLNGILGILEIRKREATSVGEHRHLDIARDSGKYLLEIVNNILDFARIDSSELEVVTTEFNLSRLLKTIEDQFDPSCEKKGLTLTSRIQPDTVTYLDGHSSILNQLLFNLVSNAVKFSSGGKIDIVASTRQRDSGLALQILVSDEGPGIPANLVDKVFEPFYQATREGTRIHESGTGLGLAICRRLVQRIDGSIDLLSTAGNGSTFRIELPVKAAPERLDIAGEQDSVAADNVCDGKSASVNGLHILVAEDSKANQVVAHDFLHSLGAKVTLAGDGGEAVRLVSEQAFDLIFMDIRMPDQDGKSATDAIRQLDCAWSSLPIVALTADAIGSERSMCINAGMNDYVVKPYTRNQLMEIITKWVPVKTNKDCESSEKHPPHNESALGSKQSDRAAITNDSIGLPEKHFNLHTLRQIQAHLSSANLRELMKVFVDDAVDRVSVICESIESCEPADASTAKADETIRAQLHTLIGEADTFGAHNLSRIAVDLQKRCTKRPDDLVQHARVAGGSGAQAERMVLARALDKEMRNISDAINPNHLADLNRNAGPEHNQISVSH